MRWWLLVVSLVVRRRVAGDASLEACEVGVCTPQTERRCVAWRQTGGCSPHGRRESRMDRDCEALITDGASGYCECEDGSRARASTCSHAPFTCSRACQTFERELCAGGWRASSTCEATGPPDPARDQTCRDLVRPGVAGYCECGLGRRVFRSGCDSIEHEREPLVCSEACARQESLYEIMGIEDAASDPEIKKAWRELSRTLHPDKVRQRFGVERAVEANERFKEVRYAFDVLSDAARREAYDAGGFSLMAKLDKEKHVPRAPTVDAQTHVTLETMFHGSNMSVAIEKRVVCRGCGVGQTTQPSRCSKCTTRCPDETVVVKARLGPFMVDQKQRQASKERCRVDRVNLDFYVPRGARDGDVVRFPGAAPQLPNALHGDVVLKLIVQKHDRFARVDDDLFTTVAISLRDALVGFSTYIDHLGGHRVNLVAHPGEITTPGMVVRIVGEGMPRVVDPAQRGDLHVEYDVRFPGTLDAATRSMIKEHFPSFV